MTRDIRAVIVLCKSRTDGIQHFATIAGKYAGATLNCLWDATQWRHGTRVQDDVLVVKTPAFKADPDEAVERAMGLDGSWRKVSFVSVNGVLYPCLDTRVVVANGEGLPHASAVLLLAFGLTVAVEARSVIMTERFEAVGNERYADRSTLVLCHATVADAR